ncbi:hypothetical protein CAPTEDRAFT_160603 [Capitella teleta]|uniref:Coiled-coil domain-containing protein 28B n=1 Tax=Capitella teleta TaxID=283909 RepID=R7U1P3_CAPTE|nr:hypothetical protein CAPTEDRAFT_160603 [Capitella teleta]|eukprot:ELT97105.1 hypothetical protein CAPTEDRAFT_160603 [Capitella teleta]
MAQNEAVFPASNFKAKTPSNHPTSLKPLNQSKMKTPQNRGVSGGSKHDASASSRPCPEHTFLTDVDDVRQVEEGLLQLLNDFHTGKLQAFGTSGTFEKMDQVREQQERLARMHFELDTLPEMQHGVDSVEDRTSANKGLHKLMDNLQELCSSIHTLQKEQNI